MHRLFVQIDRLELSHTKQMVDVRGRKNYEVDTAETLVQVGTSTVC